MSQTNIISVSDFKAHCLDYLTQMNNNNSDIIITKRGKPFAKVEPIIEKKTGFFYGKMKNKITLKGDIIEPIDVDWEENL
jgi:prevent-host-death family protein